MISLTQASFGRVGANLCFFHPFDSQFLAQPGHFRLQFGDAAAAWRRSSVGTAFGSTHLVRQCSFWYRDPPGGFLKRQTLRQDLVG